MFAWTSLSANLYKNIDMSKDLEYGVRCNEFTIIGNYNGIKGMKVVFWWPSPGLGNDINERPDM